MASAAAVHAALAGVSEQVRGGTVELHSSRNGVMHAGAGQANLLAAKAAVACKDVRVGSQQLRVRAGNAKIRRGKKSEETEYPWPDNLRADEEGSLDFLSRFKPLPNPPKLATLSFERPLADLASKIDEVREFRPKLLHSVSVSVLQLAPAA